MNDVIINALLARIKAGMEVEQAPVPMQDELRIRLEGEADGMANT